MATGRIDRTSVVFSILTQTNRIGRLGVTRIPAYTQTLTSPVYPRRMSEHSAPHPAPYQMNILSLLEHSDQYV